MMTNRELTLSIDSREDNVRWLGVAVQAICSSLSMDAQTSYNLRLCVVEAVTNCVRHAYAGAPNRSIDVVVRQVDGRLQVCVLDQGAPIPEEQLERAQRGFGDVTPEALSEGCRGLVLIDALMDDVTFHVDGTTNVLTMTTQILTSAAKGKPMPS